MYNEIVRIRTSTFFIISQKTKTKRKEMSLLNDCKMEKKHFT